MFCPQCGTKAVENAAFCISCGAPLVHPNAPGAQQPAQQVPPAQPQPVVPEGYMLVPCQPTAQPSTSIPQSQPQTTQLVPRKVYHQREDLVTMREQVPDREFSKFVDAPDKPLPFWAAKIIMSVAMLLATGWSAFQAHQLGAFELLAKGITQNVPGSLFLTLAFLWIVSAVAMLCSKFSKGAAGISGVCLLFAAGLSFMEIGNQEAPLLMLGIVNTICAVVMLISAAGGVSINLDD